MVYDTWENLVCKTTRKLKLPRAFSNIWRRIELETYKDNEYYNRISKRFEKSDQEIVMVLSKCFYNSSSKNK